MYDIQSLKDKYPIQIGLKNEKLRTISSEIKTFDDFVKKFSETLKILMVEYDGVGLAAPQLGLNIRMIAITQWKKKGKKIILESQDVLINPEILFQSSIEEIEEEGCLSVPKVYGNVSRAKNIKVKYFDKKGKEKSLFAEGYNARIILHEIDHLNGILFTDKMLA